MELRDTFNELVQTAEDPRLRRELGLRGKLRDAGNAVERIINENMSWIAEARRRRKLMMALLRMRQYEAEYRLNQSELTKQQFFITYKQFTDIFAHDRRHAGDEGSRSSIR